MDGELKGMDCKALTHSEHARTWAESILCDKPVQPEAQSQESMSVGSSGRPVLPEINERILPACEQSLSWWEVVNRDTAALGGVAGFVAGNLHAGYNYLQQNSCVADRLRTVRGYANFDSSHLASLIDRKDREAFAMELFNAVKKQPNFNEEEKGEYEMLLRQNLIDKGLLPDFQVP